MTPTTDQLRQALKVAERIQSLQSELDSLLGGGSGTGAKRGRKPGRKALTAAVDSGGGTVGNGSPLSAKRTGKKAKTKRVMSPEAREKIAAAQRKRWAKQKKGA